MKAIPLRKIIVGGLMGLALALSGCVTTAEEEPAPVENKGAPLTEMTNDTVWNMTGPNHGAFDMEAGVTVGSSGALLIKDLQDVSSTANLDGSGKVIFQKKWKSGNSGQFFAAPAGFDYANATDSSVIKTVRAATGTGTSETPILAAGSVILFWLGGNTYYRYAAIKVTQVVETPADNLDYILFNYKLSPIIVP